MSAKALEPAELGVSRKKLEKKAATNLPAIKTLPSVEPADTNLAVYETRKFFFKKTIPKKANRAIAGSQSRLKPIDSSMKQLRGSMLQREKGWDSRFVNQQIPQLFPKEKSSASKSIKPTDRRLHQKAQLLQNRLITRLSAKSLKAVVGDDRRYSSSQAIRREDDSVSNDQTVKKNYEPNENKHFANISLDMRKDQIYRMEEIYLKLDLPEFEKALIREVFRQVKKNEVLHLPQMVPKDFKAFLDSCVQVHRSVKSREQHLGFVLKKVEQLLAVPEDERTSQLLRELDSMLIDLCVLTLDVIESTVLWRQCTQQITLKYTIKGIQPTSLIYENSPNLNYLAKIMEDTKPIYSSKLYQSAIFPDPFFLSYPISSNFEERDLVYKIRASELALLEESLRY